MTHTRSGLPVAFVAVGAMLVCTVLPASSLSTHLTCILYQVGSINWTGGATKGGAVKRGEELGYFAYGGSTVVAVFAKGLLKCVYVVFGHVGETDVCVSGSMTIL